MEESISNFISSRIKCKIIFYPMLHLLDRAALQNSNVMFRYPSRLFCNTIESLTGSDSIFYAGDTTISTWQLIMFIVDDALTVVHAVIQVFLPHLSFLSFLVLIYIDIAVIYFLHGAHSLHKKLFAWCSHKD